MSPKLLVGVAMASGLLLFLPDYIILRLYMDGFKEKFGLFIGLAFIISISILAANLLVLIWKKIRGKYYDRLWLKKRKTFFKNLDVLEKEIILEMLDNPDRTIMLPLNSGSVIKLRNYKMISPAGSNHFLNPLDMRITYFLQPWVEQEIKDNPDILGA